MERREIPVEKFLVKPHDLWGNRWLLLTAGDFHKKEFNTMTVGWGSFGTMWGMPFAQAVIRPSRHTFKFIEKHDSFTLCVLPDSFRDKLMLLGTKSGRDGDKITESGLTPIPSLNIKAPGFNEAELIVECRKIYWDDMRAERFLHPAIGSHYPEKDYHRIYFGEIKTVYGHDLYSS